MKILSTGIQEMLCEGISPLPGAVVTTAMVEVIRGLMGSPPEVELLKTLCNFVISVHPPTGKRQKRFRIFLRCWWIRFSSPEK